MYWKNKGLFLLVALGLLNGCSTGFLGLAPMGDRKEYTDARDLYDQGRYKEAIGELNAYILKTKNVRRREARAYRLLGKSYEQLNLLGKALETYQEALEFHPKNVPLLVAAADLYQRTGLLDQAQQLYERALDEDPDNKEALAGLAHNYHLIGFDSKAREFYDQFFKLAPQADSLYRARYAQTFLAQRNYAQALAHLNQLLQTESENPDLWLLRARAAYGLHRTDEALSNLETALLFAPGRRDLLATQALWLYQDGQLEKSLQVAEQILKTEPENQLALFIQAMNWHQKGQKTRAQKQLARVAQLDNDSFVGKVAAQLTQSPIAH